jgi:hypothetical protein
VSDPRQKPFWMPDTQGFLAIAILALVGAVVVMLLKEPIAGENKDILNVMIGVLLGSLKDVYSFFFGSSKGSEKKDDALISGSIAPTPAQSADMTGPADKSQN